MPIPEDLRELFDDLQEQVLTAHLRWTMFRQLYGQGQLRLDLLADTARAFFHFTHFDTLNETVLAITRLTDPPKGKQNCVLEQLIRGLDDKHKTIRANLKKRLASIQTTCKPFHRRRHKHLAHRDLRTALPSYADKLQGVSPRMVETALREIRDFMNKFQTHFEDCKHLYEHGPSHGDGDALIYALTAAAEFGHLQSTGKVPLAGKFQNPYRDA